MHLRVAVSFIFVLAAIAGFLWFRTEPAPPGPRGEPGVEVVAAKNEALAPAPTPAPGDPGAGAADLPLPPPVDLDAADRDLDLHGRVIDPAGGPIAGASIECIHHPGRRTMLLDRESYDEAIIDATTRSAADGTFAIRLPRGALRELRVAHPDHSAACVPACQAGERIEVVLHPGARLEIRTVDEEGAPVAGVEGRLYHAMESLSCGDRECTTDAAGIGELRSLAPGSVWIRLSHGSLASPEPQKLDLAAGQTIVHEVVMPVGRTITGMVIDRETRRPIAGARIDESWTMLRSAVTDGRGQYRLEGVSTSAWGQLKVEATGYGSEQRSVTDGSDVIDFELGRGDVVTGLVVDGGGEPLAGITVHAMGIRIDSTVQKTESRRAKTGADGRFRSEGLHPELPYAVVIQEPGFGRVLRDVNPSHRSADGAIDVGTIVLPAPRTIEGELIDVDGEPIPGREIELRGYDLSSAMARGQFANYGSLETRRTDDLGRFRFPDLAAGEYRLTVHLRGKPRIQRVVRIVEWDPDPVFVRLELAGGESLTVEVLLRDGSPVEGAFVDARRGRRGASVSVQTDAGGIARFEGLRGNVVVRVVGPDGAFGPDPREIVPRGQTERFVLVPAAFVRGVVVTTEGGPLGGMNLQCRFLRPDGVESSDARNTEPDGTFELATHAGATVDIRCGGSRWEILPDGTRRGTWIPRVGSLEGVVAPAEGVRVVLPEIATDRTLDVRVTDAAGEPLPGISVFAHGKWSVSGEVGPVHTDESGRARLVGLPATEIMVFSGTPQIPPTEGGDVWIHPVRPEVIPSGQEIAIVLRPGWRCLATVVDAEGNPVDRGNAWGETPRGEIHQSFRNGKLGIDLLEGETAMIEVEASRENALFTSGPLEIRGGERERRIVLREE